MARRKDIEGSVRPTPGGSGQWQARLPYRLDAHRRPLPGTFASEAAAWSALRASIVDMDRNAGLRPRGRPTGKVRRVRDVLSDYIAARKSSALAPIAIRTVRDYRSVLENHVSRKSADIGRMPVHKLTGRDIRQWMDDLAADGVGVGTIANARRVLGAALAWEVREGRLGVNPATHVRIESSKARRAAMQTVDPVLLEVFNNLFMNIAEQMGLQLQNTAYSVNIKERLDFSCALFDATGNLIANAPHMPVHLGSMGESIKTVIRENAGQMQPGDVFVLNDPYHGGTHLPDVTVITPVYLDDGEQPIFYVGSRGHHADIGGITPGSMPPDSATIEDEGVLITNFKLVENGQLREQADVLGAVPVVFIACAQHVAGRGVGRYSAFGVEATRIAYDPQQLAVILPANPVTGDRGVFARGLAQQLAHGVEACLRDRCLPGAVTAPLGELVEDAAGFLSPDQIFVNRPGIGQRFMNGLIRDFVEDEAVDRHFGTEHFDEVPANGFPFAVFVGCENQFIGVLERGT